MNKNISEMSIYELDDVARLIEERRRQIFAEAITQKGLNATSVIRGEPWEYILVYSPVHELPNVWANLDESRRLLDTLANLEPAEAYRRWYPKVSEKYPSEPYTKTDAIRDTKEARQRLAEDLASGKIDSHQYSDIYPTTSFMDLAE